MSPSPVPVLPSNPVVASGPAEVGERQCGRCRKFFPGDSGPDGSAAGDWWACPPCHDALFSGPSKPAR